MAPYYYKTDKNTTSSIRALVGQCATNIGQDTFDTEVAAYKYIKDYIIPEITKIEILLDKMNEGIDEVHNLSSLKNELDALEIKLENAKKSEESASTINSLTRQINSKNTDITNSKNKIYRINNFKG